jgi:hypothetical protein
VSNLISQKNGEPAAIAIVGFGVPELAAALDREMLPVERAQVLIIVASAVTGFTPGAIEAWNQAREIYLPTLIAIAELEDSELDFEDMAAIAGKTLEPVLTPYLVLHSDEGFPTALIDLRNLAITDYSLGLKRTIPSEPEHKELVAEFATEYAEAIEIAGEDGFEQGLLFPAIPISLHIKLGVAEITEYLDRIPGSS